MTATSELVKQFNVVVRTAYNREYQEFTPEFANTLYRFSSGLTDSMRFPFFNFLRTFEQWKGTREHQTFPEGFQFRIVNRKWDMAVDVDVADFERASNPKNDMMLADDGPLNPFKDRIADIAAMAKDHPVELAFELMVNGTTNTLGTTFDGQNFFSTTHSYGIAAGTEDNIVTGSGTSITQLEADFIKAMSRLAGFSFTQSPNASARNLNKNVDKNLLVCAPPELHGAFFNLKNKGFFNNADNAIQGTFEFKSLVGLSDVNDWYLLLLDEKMMKPFLHQEEKPAVLDMPSMTDVSVKERDTLVWGARKRDNVAYGAWWKAIKVTNT